MQFARLNDVLIHYEDREAGGVPALVFANSLGTDFRIWDAVLARLQTPLRILRYDMRGHGLSDLGRPPYRMEDHVGDLIALLDARGIRGAILCGLSVGGMVAQGLAGARPDLLRGLILSDTGHRIGTAEMWNTRIAAVEAGGVEAIGDAVMERWFTADYRRRQPEALALWRNMLVRTPTGGYAGTSAAIRDADLTEAARGIRLPTLCICGDQDIATPPELVRSLAALVSGATFREIPGSGHLPCIEQAEVVAGLIDGFCRAHGRG